MHMPRIYMDSLSLTSQFQNASSAPWAEKDHSSFSDFMRNCREGNFSSLQKNLKHLSGAHLSSGLSAAVDNGQLAIVRTLIAHTSPTEYELKAAVEKNDIEMLKALNDNKIIQTKIIGSDQTIDLLRSAVGANASDAIHYLIEIGYKIDTSSNGHIYNAGLYGHVEALDALLQHVTFVDPDCVYDIETNHMRHAPTISLLTALEDKRTFLDTFNKYKYYQKHKGTAPARPSSNKVKDFAVNSMAAMMNSTKPSLTQDAIDDFNDNKYKKKKSAPKRDRHIPGASFFGGCL